MGLLKSGINEVIATTGFNAAPMGIHLRDGKASMVLFRGSHTAENIDSQGFVVANFIHDPVLYVRTAFEDIPKDAFTEEQIRGGTVYRLAGADAWAAFSTTVEKTTLEAVRVRLTLEKEIIERVTVIPVNRGFGSIIDATVHATRYRMNRDPGLAQLIEYHAGIVRKCGGEEELAALSLLFNYCKDTESMQQYLPKR